MGSGQSGTQGREDARGGWPGLEGKKRWKIWWVRGPAGVRRAERTRASAGGIQDTRWGAQSGTSGKPEEDPKRGVATAPRKGHGGGEASTGAWGIEARERDGSEGLETEETVAGMSCPHQARG